MESNKEFKELMLKMLRVIIMMILILQIFCYTKNDIKILSLYCMGSKPLRIRFDEIDGFIKIYDGIRYLVLFGHL